MLVPLPGGSPYASSDPGFAALPVGDLLTSNEDLVARIQLCYGADRETFERDVLALILRYAGFVHLLPATADNYFSAPGGLLRLGLEAGFFSLQGTDAHIFSGRSTISVRRHLEPRWRLATFVAGLCCEAHRVFSHVIVTDSAGAEWPGYLQPLADWLLTHHTERYFLRWRPQAAETRGLGIFALPHVVPPAVLQYLAEDNTVIVPHLMASVGGIALYRDHNVLDELVRRSLALVIDRNLVANADRYGSPQFGLHLERYLVDALRRLASGNSAWQPNREKSRVWFGADGLFLLWPGAAEDVHKLLDADQLPGIPKAPETMLELLLSAGVLEATAEGHSTWPIQPPGAKAATEAAKLSSPAILFAGADPEPAPLAQKLVRRPGDPDPASSRSTAAPAAQQATTKSGTQLLLIPQDAPPVSSKAVQAVAREPETESAVQPSAPIPAPRPFSLDAPMRLNPVVRDAVATVIHTLNSDAGPMQCCTVANGVFVPLVEFERRGLQPSMALRALADVRMLARPEAGASPTSSREFNGAPTLGLVLDPRFVAGLDLEGFSLPAPEVV